MGNREFYKKKLEVISAIDDSQIKKPHHIPVSVYIEEADTLYHRALQDKDELVAAGVAPELIEDLPQRHGALIETEKKWQKQWKNRNKGALEWDKQSPAGYNLRKRLLADFYYAFRKEPDLMAYLKEISQPGPYSGMIQDLNILSNLGRANTRLLEVINFDFSLLDKADRTSKEMARLLAAMNYDKGKGSEVKRIRDQAYTHLKEAVDEIRGAGKYVFRENKEHSLEYTSEYMRHLKSKQKRKPKKKATK
ncbi:MAG: hypothetical protein PVH61_37090 [Candidatus Aminicenantes bacterium]|jgi:hypothetical protein